ncbi:MAG: hypothetical protein QM791_10925 [Ferruginibacter sp.]
MKKIITLFVSVFTLTVAFAQYGPGNDYGKERNAVYSDRYKKDGDRRRNDHYTALKRERDMQVAEINREYDRKIQMVRNKVFMGRSKKERLIYQLEDKRRDEIRNVYAKYNDRLDDRYGNRNW